MKLFFKLIIVATLIFAGSFTIVAQAQAQSCANNPTSSNSVTLNFSVPEANTYTIWSRLIAPDATNNSFWLQVDGGCAVNVGDAASIPTNQLTWVNYQNGNTGNVVSLNLSAGNHTLKVTEREGGVGLDRVIVTTNATCVPTGVGNNCPVATNTPIPDAPTATPTTQSVPTPTPTTPAGMPTSTPIPTPTTTTPPTSGVGSSLRFDGTSDVARTVNIPRLTAFTIEAWVKRASDNGTYQAILSDANSNYSQGMSTLFIDANNGDCSGAQDQFAYFEKVNSSTQCSGVTATIGRWYHIAVTRESNGTRRIFVDGVLRSTQSNSPAPIDSNGVFALGRAGDANEEYFAGNIDEVRISNVARYTAGFTPSRTALQSDSSTIALYHLDEGTGQAINDASSNRRNGTLGSASGVDNRDPSWSTDSPISNNAARATTQSQSQTVTLTPVDDAYVTSDATTKNYGTTTVLNTSGRPNSIAYLKFDLGSLAGKTVTKATLRVRTSNDTSSNQQNVKPVSNTSWQENAIMYTNRPAVTNTVLGRINSQNQANAWQEVILTSTVAANVGRPISLAIDSDGNNNVWFWSKESTSKPELVIETR